MSLLKNIMILLEIGTRGDQGIIGFDAYGTYLGNSPGPMPPKQSPIEAEYEEGNMNLGLDGTPIDGPSTNDPNTGFVQNYTPENPFYTNNEGIVRATDE